MSQKEQSKQDYRSIHGMPYYPFYYPDGSPTTLPRGKEDAQKELDAALECEDYVRAAELRDEIANM